jgi:antirestriction protein ArdC
MSKKIQEAITNELIKSLEESKSMWSKEWKVMGVPMNAETKRPYSGINFLILSLKQMAKGYKSCKWITMNKCNALGGKVNKGEKSTMITYYNMIEGQDKEGNTKKFPLLKSYLVFNIEQTTLADNENFKEELKELDNTLMNNDIESLLKEYTKVCEIRHLIQDKACYSPVFDNITMPVREQFSNLHAYYSTVLHEIAHSTGHKSRLDRNLKGLFGNEDYALEELIAEISSMFLLSHFEVDNTAIKNNNIAYVNNWIKVLKSDASFIFKASKQANNVFDYLTNKKYADKKELVTA